MKTRLVSYTYIITAMIMMFIPLSSQLMLKNTSAYAPETESGEETETASPFEETSPSDEPASGTDAEKQNIETTVKVFLHSEDRLSDMPLEEYLVGVVMAEMPYTFEKEALKAQAIAARTYCLYRLDHGGVADHEGADVCTSSEHCAAYLSLSEAKERWGEENADEIFKTVSDAVKETEGMFITYDGEPIAAVFHSSSYKKTESALDVWGNDMPYLVSVDSPEGDVKNEVTIDACELYKKLGGKGDIPYMTFYTEKNEAGRVDTVKIGDITVKAKKLRSLIGLRSTRFELSEKNGILTFTTHGSGHGIGMSQVGANEMAKEGKTCDEILLSYYTGVKIEKSTEG